MTKAGKRLIAAAREALAIARGKAKPAAQLIVVTAVWDAYAEMWTVRSDSLPGLITEVATLEELDRKLPAMIADLLE